MPDIEKVYEDGILIAGVFIFPDEKIEEKTVGLYFPVSQWCLLIDKSKVNKFCIEQLVKGEFPTQIRA